MKKIALVAAILVASAACKNEEIDSKPAAEVSEPAAVEKAEEPAKEEAAEPTTVAIDKSASKIDWKAAKVSLAHDGGFKEFDGKVTYGPDGKLQGVDVTIDTTSVWSDTEKLTGHLKSEDFFAVEKYPTATFVSTKIEPGEGDMVNITGNLDMHGVKKAVTFPATVKMEGGKLVADADFKINRFDWGIEYKGKPDDLIQKDVNLKLHIEAPTPAES